MHTKYVLYYTPVLRLRHVCHKPQPTTPHAELKVKMEFWQLPTLTHQLPSVIFSNWNMFIYSFNYLISLCRNLAVANEIHRSHFRSVALHWTWATRFFVLRNNTFTNTHTDRNTGRPGRTTFLSPDTSLRPTEKKRDLPSAPNQKA
jgi:hypothetical protein